MIKPTLTLLAAFAAMGAIGYYTADTHTPPRDNPAVLKPVIEVETTHEERMKACTDSGRSEQDCSLFVERSYTGEGYQHLREAK